MKRFISLFLVVVLIVSCLAGCNKQVDPKDPTKEPIKEPTTEATKDLTDETEPTEIVDPTNPDIQKPPVLEDVGGVGFNKFDTGFINHLNKNHSHENYMVSTTSLKMALALAAIGAKGETLDEIVEVVGYENLDEYLAWTQAMIKFEEDSNKYFDNRRENEWEKDYDSAFSIANSIWHNSDWPGEFLESYKTQALEMDAEFATLPGDDLKDKINSWINNETKGLIPEMFSSPLNQYSNILVNALYMKNCWQMPFSDYLTHEGEFTTINGEVVAKELMEQTEVFSYYEDEGCQILIMEMDYGFKMAVVLGDNSNIVTKLEQSRLENIHVILPKFEIETTIEEEIIEYLRSAGMVSAFDGDFADFTNMNGEDMHIEKILQKTKISVDENGLEAAAVTAIMMENDSCAPEDPVIPIDFIADKPFAFYIYAENDNLVSPELLFYGQYVE